MNLSLFSAQATEAFPSTGNAAVDAYLAETLKIASDGLTLKEFAERIRALINLAVSEAAKAFSSGPEKKAWVLKVVELAYDLLAPLTLNLGFPWSLLAFVARPWFKSLALNVFNLWIEDIYARLKPELKPAG